MQRENTPQMLYIIAPVPQARLYLQKIPQSRASLTSGPNDQSSLEKRVCRRRFIIINVRVNKKISVCVLDNKHRAVYSCRSHVRGLIRTLIELNDNYLSFKVTGPIFSSS